MGAAGQFRPHTVDFHFGGRELSIRSLRACASRLPLPIQLVSDSTVCREPERAESRPARSAVSGFACGRAALRHLAQAHGSGEAPTAFAAPCLASFVRARVC